MIDAAVELAQRRRKARIRASLFTLPAVLVLLSLGTWQVFRLQEKEQLIADLTAKYEAAAVAIPADLGSSSELHLTKVRAEGHYLHEQESRLTNRLLDKKLGDHLTTPFRLTDGRTILVDRGWVPLESEVADLDRPEGRVTIEGILRTGGFSGPAFLQPVNDHDAKRYHWPELSVMLAGEAQAQTGLYLVLTPGGSAGVYPQPNPPSSDLPNNHLEYVITWYALALILVIIYVVFFFRRPDPS